MADIKPGNETSEFQLAKWVGIAGAVLSAFGVVLESLAAAGIGHQWVGIGLVVVGALTKIAVALGYSKDRAALKASQTGKE